MSSCVHPISLVINGRAYQVRCGTCANCIKEKQKSWALRAEIEGKYWSTHPNPEYHSGYMFTFTYDNNHVPVVFRDDVMLGYDLVYSHISQLLRDLRKRNKGGKRVHPRYVDRIWLTPDSDKPQRGFSYMLCGELGATYGRCHFHMLAYGITEEEARWLQSKWIERYAPEALKHNRDWMFGKGCELGCNIKKIGCKNKDFVKVGKYCSKYCSKAQQSKHVFDEMTQRPRIFASRAFGYKSCERIEKWLVASRKSLLPHSNLEKFKFSDVNLKHSNLGGVYKCESLGYDLNRLSRLYEQLKYVSATIEGKNVRSRLPVYYIDRLLPKRKFTLFDNVTGRPLTRSVPEDNTSFSVVYSKRNAYTAFVLRKNDSRDRDLIDSYVQRGFVQDGCSLSGVYYSAECKASSLVARQNTERDWLCCKANVLQDLQFFNSQCDGQ